MRSPGRACLPSLIGVPRNWTERVRRRLAGNPTGVAPAPQQYSTSSALNFRSFHESSAREQPKHSSCLATRGPRRCQCMAYMPYSSRGWLSSGVCGRISWTLATLLARWSPLGSATRPSSRHDSRNSRLSRRFQNARDRFGSESIGWHPCNSDGWQPASCDGVLHEAIKRHA
jgi:hypothetical protein